MDPIDVTLQIPWRDAAIAYASTAPRQRADIARTDEAQNHIEARAMQAARTKRPRRPANARPPM